MTKPVTMTSEPSELEALVDAFETAQVREGRARVENFLPNEDHPRYREIVLELLCVDLEYGWQRGTPKTLDQYQAEYPDVLSDSANLRVLAFEEYRQRCQTHTRVNPHDYERRYGIAARMLTLLGYRQVILLTNNPAKVQALASNDIEIVGSAPLLGTVNPHNVRYLATKADRAQHALKALLDPVANDGPKTPDRDRSGV